MEFDTGYASPMDREYYTSPVTAEKTDLSEPIIPIGELGVTVPENDPQSGANILQNVQATIRAGAGTMQIVMMTPPTAALGGRAKAYGKEVREAIRETARANDVTITGLEMPTAMNSMAGLGQQGFSEELRFNNIQEIRDNIKFIADIAGGGGIDIVSQEFPLTIFDAKWNQKGKWAGDFKAHEREEDLAVKSLVDKRTGEIIQSARLSDESYYPKWKRAKEGYTDDTGNRVKKDDFIDMFDRKVLKWRDRVPEYDKEKGEFNLIKLKVKDFKDEADDYVKFSKEVEGVELKPEDIKTAEEFFFESKLRTRQAQDQAWVDSHGPGIRRKQLLLDKAKQLKRVQEEAEKGANEEKLENLRKQLQNEGAVAGTRFGFEILPEKKPTEIIADHIEDRERDILIDKNYSYGHQAEMQNVDIQLSNIVTVEKYAKELVFDSYAEAGMAAMLETVNNSTLDKDIHVGPELGWPGRYGGHPEEYVEIIEKSREKMVEKLRDQGYKQREAEERAARHIQGVFDTSHLGMWLNNFRRKAGESEDQRLDEFKKWYNEQVEFIAKKNVTAGIQVVDSASGAHGHLPPGQGIFPVVNAVKTFKKFGYNGWIVSEGHEEEKFGKNRILLNTWEAFGSPMARMGMYAPQQWGGIRQAYFGRTYTPNFIVGAYSPSNEFKLWTEVPLE